MIHAVIMAGGAGTRFWPASRRLLPKQLLKLAGDRTMLQATVDRLEGLVPATSVFVLTNRDLTSAVRQQLPRTPAAMVLGEPCKRDTAPCIGLAAALILRRDEDAIMLVMPSDQLIQPRDKFHAALRFACQLVEEEPRRIATFGIRPTFPAETFGYIERGEPLAVTGAAPAYRVRMFREKPSAAVARQYLAAGGFYWNSGMFVWKARTIMAALRQFEPAMCEHLSRIAATWETDRFPATLEAEFGRIQSKSIDYAVMERYDNAVVVEAPFEWDDVGSWGSLARIAAADEQGNCVAGRHLGVETRNCVVHGGQGHLIVTVGMEDCIVVHTPDATLVARKSDEESLRRIVGLIQERGWTEYL